MFRQAKRLNEHESGISPEFVTRHKMKTYNIIISREVTLFRVQDKFDANTRYSQQGILESDTDIMRRSHRTINEFMFRILRAAAINARSSVDDSTATPCMLIKI